MVSGMATTKITVTLPDDQVKQIRAQVSSGAAPNVSAFVKRAVDVALQDAAGWRAMLDEAMQQTGGPLTAKERAWVDSFLPRRPRKGGGKRKAA